MTKAFQKHIISHILGKRIKSSKRYHPGEAAIMKAFPWRSLGAKKLNVRPHGDFYTTTTRSTSGPSYNEEGK
jgi:hypothetical protein